MAKFRVHELAKEVNKSNKDVMEYLLNKGVDVKSHMSLVADEAAESVRKAFGKKAEQPAEGAEAAKEEKPKKLLPIEYFTLITLISTILSLFVGIGVDNYIHRPIKASISNNIFDLNIRNMYEQLDEYSTKDKKITVEPS